MDIKQSTSSREQGAQQIAKNDLLSWLRFLVLLALACFILTYSVGLTVVSGNSMNPTLKDHSVLLINRLSAHLGAPKAGDIVLVHYSGYTIVKRVIGLPGDTVAIKQGIVYVNNHPLPEIYTLGQAEDMSPVQVEPGHIFVMGDNRTPGESLDSRSADVGQLAIASIEGYAEVSLFPPAWLMKPLKF